MKINTTITVNDGSSMTGDTGRVCRVCELTGFIFVLLDKNKGDRFYEYLEYGPFAKSELKVTDEK